MEQLSEEHLKSLRHLAINFACIKDWAIKAGLLEAKVDGVSVQREIMEDRSIIFTCKDNVEDSLRIGWYGACEMALMVEVKNPHPHQNYSVFLTHGQREVLSRVLLCKTIDEFKDLSCKILKCI